jgi:hypothetical protein
MSKRLQEVTYTPSKTDGEKLIVACTRCASDTRHVVLTSIQETGSEPMHGDMSFEWGVDYQIVQCQGCETVSFRKASSNSEDYDPEFNSIYREDLYPSRTNNWQLLKDHHILPINLGRIYQETVLALNNDQPILSSIGIRAIIETVSKEENAAGDNLKKKIESLVTKGKLTQDGALILHKIRDLGNDAAHEAKIPTATELKLAMRVVEHLIQSVYILPFHAEGTFGG